MSVQLQLQLPARTELGNTQTKYIVFKNSDLKTCRPRREVKLVQSLAFAHVVAKHQLSSDGLEIQYLYSTMLG